MNTNLFKLVLTSPKYNPNIKLLYKFNCNKIFHDIILLPCITFIRAVLYLSCNIPLCNKQNLLNYANHG